MLLAKLIWSKLRIKIVRTLYQVGKLFHSLNCYILFSWMLEDTCFQPPSSDCFTLSYNYSSQSLNLPPERKTLSIINWIFMVTRYNILIFEPVINKAWLKICFLINGIWTDNIISSGNWFGCGIWSDQRFKRYISSISRIRFDWSRR